MSAHEEERAGAFERGLAEYAEGRWFDAHESWETLWVREPDPTLKSFMQGLILVAAALHKLFEMHNPAGAVRLLDRARDRLAEAPEGMRGLDLLTLRADIARARAAIAEHGQLDAALIPRMRVGA